MFIRKRVYLCVTNKPKRNKMNTTNTFTEKEQFDMTQKLFVAMIKATMVITGKSFDDCKVEVKEYLKSNNLM